MCGCNPMSSEDILGLSVNVVSEPPALKKSGKKYPKSDFILTDIGPLYKKYKVFNPTSGKKDWVVDGETMAYTDVDINVGIVCECNAEKGYWFPFHATIQVKPRIHLREWYVDDSWWNSTVEAEMDHVNDLLSWASNAGLPLMGGKLGTISARKVAENFLETHKDNQPKDLTKDKCQEANAEQLLAELRDSLVFVFAETKRKWDLSGKHDAGDQYPKDRHLEMDEAKRPNRTRGPNQ